MTAPTVSTTQNIVRVCLAELQHGGKVAIHCHAGFGRTGIVVACLMIARSGTPANDAVTTVRQKRYIE
jgi:protein-tyrosine phosphatase